jgi:hypothetical protein
MAVPEANISNTGSLAKFLESIKSAGVPERVTFEFLKSIGFRSSNDRPIIGVMKAIGFLDANGAPTDQYKAFRGHDSARVLGRALKNAYADIFLAHTKAQDLPLDKLRAIIASKSAKGEAVVERIARTFQVLAKAADLSDDATTPAVADKSPKSESKQEETPPPLINPIPRSHSPTFHYNIEIHLPTTTDITVYNAIFKSLRDNLL